MPNVSPYAHEVPAASVRVSRAHAMSDGSSGEPAPGREFNTREAAAFLRCSEGYLIKLRASDGPPYHRRWKRKGIYYLQADLMEWRRGRRYLSTSEY